MKKKENKEPAVPEEYKKPAVTRTYSKRLVMLVVSGLMVLLGVGSFILYMFNTNMIIGVPGVIIGVTGVFLLKHYWGQSKDAIVTHIGEPTKVEVNSLTIYRDRVVFENIYKPGGFLWKCINDGKHYFVNWEVDGVKKGTKAIAPFVLPDQQYYDPQVFAERVLTLPAHRKLFTRKVDLIHKLRPVILGVIAIGVAILIIVTTGGNGG